MNQTETNQVIVKYALLLTILYAVQLLVNYSLKIGMENPTNNIESTVKLLVSLLFVMVGNGIAVLFVMKDKKKFQIKNRYLVLLTFFFCPVGVCVLLIHIINRRGGEDF